MLKYFKMSSLLLLHLLVVFSYVRENFATPAIRPQSQRGIIFPPVEEDSNCFADAEHRIQGTCTNILNCPSALNRWQTQNIRPQTCYFNKFEHVVCCASQRISSRIVKRRSEIACDSNHGRIKRATLRTLVVHGTPTKQGEYPYMAALGWPSNTDQSIVYRCGGALISPRFVLTAAHCADLSGVSPSVVRLGGDNLSNVADNKIISIQRIIVHPAYDARNTYNDIALIELSRDAGEKPACVWSQQELEDNHVTAIGYGHTKFGGSGSNHLLKAALQLVQNEQCSKYYPPDAETLQRGIINSQICVGDPKKKRDTCQGDSGGPIIMKAKHDKTISYVVGITSFGQGCSGTPPSIYTRTSSYIDWIEDIVWPIRQNGPARRLKKRRRS